MSRWLLCLAMLLLGGLCLSAQDVNDTAVIEVAERLYCPVCENIPLDECQTTACLEWKEEIRQQLAAGRDAQQIIDSFVERFGDHVVGLPQTPLLRAVTLLLPLLATIFALGLGARTFRRFSRQPKLRPAADGAAQGELSEAAYRQRLEDDLRARA